MKKLQKGDVFILPEGITVQTTVPKHYLSSDDFGNFSMVPATVCVNGQLGYLQSTYIVTEAKLAGGGYGHGPGDVYPDGWRITAREINNNVEVEFYQSGSFNTTYRGELSVIGRATEQISYVVEYFDNFK